MPLQQSSVPISTPMTDARGEIIPIVYTAYLFARGKELGELYGQKLMFMYNDNQSSLTTGEKSEAMSAKCNIVIGFIWTDDKDGF